MPLTNKIIDELRNIYVCSGQKIPYLPIAFNSGKGALLYDYDGKEYIDFLSSASSANLGHGNTEIAEAVCTQMSNLAQYTNAYFNAKEPVDLAKELCELAPGEKPKKVLFSCTGSASIDGAIKIVRSYTGRTKIISFIESYHGSTYGALSISALSNGMREKIGPVLPGMHHFNYPNCYRCKYGNTEENCHLECFAEIEDAFIHYIPANDVAAFFIEPIAGDAGLVIPPKKYMNKLRTLCDDNGILLVSDEIQQGLGRTGKWFCIENFGVEADLYVLGKSVGGGLPLGIVIGNEEVIESLQTPAHTFSMIGNSAVSVAALKNLEITKRLDINSKSVELGEYTKQAFERLQSKYELIGDVRSIGLSIGVDLVKDRTTREKNYDAAAKICNRCMDKGLILIFIGRSTLRIQPPLVITKEQIDQGIAIIEEAIIEYENGEIGDEVFDHIKGWD